VTTRTRRTGNSKRKYAARQRGKAPTRNAFSTTLAMPKTKAFAGRWFLCTTAIAASIAVTVIASCFGWVKGERGESTADMLSVVRPSSVTFKGPTVATI
jgi:hypothetical protein